MRKTLCAILAVFMCFAFLGCSAAPAAESQPAATASENEIPAATATEIPAEPAKIVLNDWSWADSGWTDCLTEVFDTFRTQHGDQVELEVVGNSYADTLSTLLVQAAAGNGPDVAMIKAEWLPQFLELGCIADISGVISDEAKADYGEASLASYTKDGQLLALPFFGQPYALFYNKTLLEEAGVTVPTTFDELLAASAKVAALGTDENGNKIYGLGLVNSGLEVAEGYNIFPWLWARGGDFLDANGKVVLNSAQNLVAFQEIQNLYTSEQSPVGLSYKEMRNLFASGNLGFFWDLQSQTASFVQASAKGEAFLDEIGAVPIPGAKAGDGVGYVNDIVLVVFNTCKNMEAAGILAEYLGSETTIQIMYNNGKGKMSSRQSVMAQVFANVDNDITKAYVDSMKTNRSLPAMNLAFADADEAITNAVTMLATGSDPATVLADLDAKVKGLYGQ